MQKSLDVVFVELKTKHAYSAGRHCDKGVGEYSFGAAAVIYPKLVDLALKEFVRAADRSNGALNESLFVELAMRERVERFTFANKRLDYISRYLVSVKIVGVRLVGNVEIGALGNAERTKLCRYSRYVLPEKFSVFLRVSRNVPAEHIVCLAVFGNHNVGSEF